MKTILIYLLSLLLIIQLVHCQDSWNEEENPATWQEEEWICEEDNVANEEDWYCPEEAEEAHEENVVTEPELEELGEGLWWDPSFDFSEIPADECCASIDCARTMGCRR